MRALAILVALSVTACEEPLPESPIGAACLQDTDCPLAGGSCVKESDRAMWVGGYCTVRDCTASSCPSGSFCQMGGTALGSTTCLKTCATQDDCRDGYRCCPTTAPTGGMVCAPPMAGTLCP